MDQWCSSLLSAFARDLVCGAKNELRYPCCFNGFVKDLEGEQEEFIKTKESVNNRVDRAKKQAMKNEKDNEWLEGANALEAKVKGALNRARTTKTCFGHCPNWIRRYRQAKELEKVKKELEEYNKKGDKYVPAYERVASLPGIEHLPREEYFEFASRQYEYYELIEAMKDDKVSMFGLYGMGGSGKTTMALKLQSTAEAEHLFDKVLFVPVSSNVQVRGIQDKIASALQFRFTEDGESERARRLCKRLIDEKRTLVILDDVWGKLDLGAIGIPVSGDGDHYFCKVLITTRSLNACTQMNCMRKIPLSILTDEEAWELFQKQANIYDDTPNKIKMLGKEISNECKGLPVAIAGMAGTLKDKVEADWRNALDRLKSSTPVDIENGYENPYKCLEVSYNNLSTDEAKSLFLLCSVFPKGYEIPVETLTIYAIGLGLIGREVRSFEMARNEVSAAKNNLVNSSFLSLSIHDEQEHVKMHDLIRDVALWIARKDRMEIKCVLEEDVTLKFSPSSMRYLWCKKVPNDLNCSRLEFLRLETLDDRVISDEIFKGMEMLSVLCLTNENNESNLTLSFLKSLLNLRCLILSSWKLDGMSCLRYLTKLESLMLSKCSFSELHYVSSIKLLSFTECYMDRNPFQVIGKHLKLEELYYDSERIISSTDEDHVEFFQAFCVPQILQRFRIKVGSLFSKYDDIESLDSHRSLRLSCFDTSKAEIIELAKKAEVLHAGNIMGDARNIIPDIFQIEGRGTKKMNYGWIDLFLCESKEIECVVDTTKYSGNVFFSKLRWLRIINMQHLRALYHGVYSSGLFEKLEKLSIRRCPMLTYLLTMAAARSLVHLQELEIIDCKRLEHVVENDSSEISSQDDDKLVFSKLKSVTIGYCNKLEHTIPFTHGLGLLESLCIYNCSSLEHVLGQGMHEGNNTSGHQSALNLELPLLEHVELRDNPRVISIFPSCSAILMCPSLKYFELENCPKFDIMCVNTFETSTWKVQEDAGKEPFHHILGILSIKNDFKVESIFSIGHELEISRVSLGLLSLKLSNLDEMKYICVGLKNSLPSKISSS